MSKTVGKEIHFGVNEKVGAVSGLLLKPDGAQALLALAHGAGAGMRHRFMETVALKLADGGVATMRYQCPYMEKRIKRPDSEAVLTDTVRAAMVAAKKIAGDLPLFAGGKSMGGRMTSLAAARQQNAGGAPVGLRYGFMWWVPPSDAPRPNFLASGYAGQFIWVNPALEVVIAVNSTVSPQSQQRGQAFQLIRQRLYPVVVKRAQAN